MDLCGLLWGSLIVLVVILLLAVLDIKRRGYSRKISWNKLLKLYFLRKLGSVKLYRLHHKFEANVRQFKKVQSKFLLDRIRRCEKTAFGRDNRFSSIRTVEDFRRNLPVSDFSHVEDYVNRLADGEKSALFGDEDDIYMFTTSSGTTGKNKRIPMSAQGAKDMQDQILYGPYQWAMQTLFPWNLKRMITVANSGTSKYTKAGYVVSIVSSVVSSQLNRMTALLYTTPPISQQVKSEVESNYIHALFGLCDKHISMIRNLFIHHFLTLMRRIRLNQLDLINDIRRGRIKEDLDIPDSVRAELNAHLTPMPERAAEIEREFAKGFEGIVPRIWPDVVRITGIWSGSTNEMYYKEAKEILGPNIPILSFSYSASEGYIGSNLELTRPGPPRYTLIPDVMFYEFLPIINDRIPDLTDVNPKDLLLSHELEVNKEYEIIITNASGLYRYRIGDVIRVMGFYQQAPQVEFLYRSGQTLNIVGEKISEEVFFHGLRNAAKRWPATTLKDYTVASSQFGPRHKDELSYHYLLFVEVEGQRLAAEQTAQVDGILQENSERYASYRKLKKLDKIATYQVSSGTFSRFRAHLLETTLVTAGQFKMPRVLKSRDRVDWFLKNVLS